MGFDGFENFLYVDTIHLYPKNSDGTLKVLLADSLTWYDETIYSKVDMIMET